jgi:hypothetical protein
MAGRMKRTMLVLEDACIDRVRPIAQREGRQLSEVVNEVLVDALPRSPMGRPRVNLGDRNALEALLDS